MNREMAIPYVSFVLDDSLNGRELGADQHAIIRGVNQDWHEPSRLIGWQCGFEPLFVAVHSCIDVAIDVDFAIEIATDFLSERGWFSGDPTEPDYVL